MEEIRQILDHNERVLWEDKPNFWPFVFGSFIVTVMGLFFLIPTILIAMLAGVGLLAFLIPTFWFGVILIFAGPVYSYFVYKFIHYAITNKRVIIKTGLIGRDFKMVDFDKISDVEVNVSFWDKLLAKSSGTILISTPGTVRYTGNSAYRTPYRLSNVPNPYWVFKFFKKVSFDVKTDIEFPNKYRPNLNPGYRTRYEPGR